MPKRILVTGGAGFIGSHLCARLLEAGNDVTCLDDFSTGSRTNIEGLLQNGHFHLLEHDVTEPLHVEVDEIYNLACPASPDMYRRDPVKTIKTNIMGAINMLELAKKQGAKIQQASTSEVYGDPQVHPQTETYWGNVNPLGQRASYNEAKRAAETLFFTYHRQYGVDMRIARIFNTYGPNMQPDDGRVVSNFIVQALQSKDITVYGDGSQTRSFQYVDDTVRGIALLMDNTAGFTGPVNIGNPAEITINELAQTILRLVPASKSNIVYKSLPEDDPARRRPDITLARRELGWKPTVKLEDGLSKTITYFKKQLTSG